MPIIKSALKKQRQDKVRTKNNESVKHAYKDSVRSVRIKGVSKEKVKPDDLKTAYSAIDKAAKKGIIHKNKASRIKSRITKIATKSK